MWKPFWLWESASLLTRRGVQPLAHGPRAAQDGYECGPTQNCKLTWNPFLCLSVFVSVYVFNGRPKTILPLPVWPRDAQRWGTPAEHRVLTAGPLLSSFVWGWYSERRRGWSGLGSSHVLLRGPHRDQGSDVSGSGESKSIRSSWEDHDDFLEGKKKTSFT